MRLDKDTLRKDRTALVTALQEAGAKFRGNNVLCPFHDDHRASGNVYQGKQDGVWRFKCLACGVGGDVFDMRALANGTTAGTELRAAVGGPAKLQLAEGGKNALSFASLQGVRQWLTEKVGKIVSEHTYTTEAGDVIQVIFRCEGKDGKTYRPIYLTDRGYALGACAAPRPLYNLLRVAESETVVVVEGEKCADALTRYGFTATTSPAGAKNARHADWTPLAGKAVVLWPDNDAEGKRYVLDVQQILGELQPASRLSVLDPASLDLAEGEDVADFVEQLCVLNKDDAEITGAIAEALKKAKAVSVATEVQQRVAEITAGRYASIDWPWDSVNKLTRALLPGTVTLLVGNPGASKSFMTLEAFAYWHAQGLRVSLYEAEEDKVFHLVRVLAQKSGQGNVTDPQWVKDNAEVAERIISQHKSFLESFGRVLHANAETQPTLSQLSAWIEQQAKTGSRLIGIDPITAAERCGDAWVADAKFLQSIKRTATDYGCSVMLVTHPIKTVSFPDLSQVAGSAAYQRFAQTILWLESHDTKTSTVKTPCGTTETEHNRTVHILKARNGKGQGVKLACNFQPESLTLNEIGIIVKAKKHD